MINNADFTNKTVVVTGGLGGIGNVIANSFVKLGADVHIFDNTQNDRNELMNVSTFHRVNITQPDKISEVIDNLVNRTKKIDILVNCAGIILRKNALETTDKEWQDVISVNLNGTFFCSKYVIPFMKSGSSIINISSGWGLTGGKNAVSYCASKGGVVQLTKAMALDHGHQGIRINCICPGDTDTPMLKDEERQLSLPENFLIQEAVNRPLGRVGTAHDIAAAVLFLASEGASFITGTVLVVDGGNLAGVL